MIGLKWLIDDLTNDLDPNSGSLVKRVVEGSPDDFLRDKINFYPAVNIDYATGSITSQVVNLTLEIEAVEKVTREETADFDNGKAEGEAFRTALFIIGRAVAFLTDVADPQRPYQIVGEAVIEKGYPEDEGADDVVAVRASIPISIQNVAHDN